MSETLAFCLSVTVSASMLQLTCPSLPNTCAVPPLCDCGATVQPYECHAVLYRISPELNTAQPSTSYGLRRQGHCCQLPRPPRKPLGLIAHTHACMEQGVFSLSTPPLNTPTWHSLSCSSCDHLLTPPRPLPPDRRPPLPPPAAAAAAARPRCAPLGWFRL